jgi:predicted YcjX-like family ATPase
MRDDIKQLIENRPSWRLITDREYQDLVLAIEYAKKNNNQPALQELELMLEQRRKTLLE